MGLNFSMAGQESSLTQYSGVPKEKQMIGAMLENDVFAGTDNNYTNGARIEWMSSTDEDPNSFNACLGTLMGGTNASSSWRRFMGMGNSELLTQQWGVSLTQLIFTPELKSRKPLWGQHPYVGSLCLALTSIVKSEDRSNVFNVQVGWTGPSSLSKQCQRMIHTMLKMEQWPGWANQMPGECIFNFNFTRQYRLRFLESNSVCGLETDGLAYWFAQAGTIAIQGGGGFMLRFGKNLPNTGFSNSARSITPISSPFIYNKAYSSNWSLYGFIGGEVKYVGRNLYLDGPAFHSYPKYVQKFPFVASWSFGVGTRYKDLFLDVGWSFETKEYHTQRHIHGTACIQAKWAF